MSETPTKSKIIDVTIACAVAYALLAAYTVMLDGHLSGLLKAVLLFAFAMIGPAMAVTHFWYGVPVLGILIVIVVMIIRKVDLRPLRIVALLTLVLVWLVYGIMCFTVITGGA